MLLTKTDSREMIDPEAPQTLFVDKMRRRGMDSKIIDVFSDYYRQVVDGRDGFLTEASIRPAPEAMVVSYEDLQGFEMHGRSVLPRTARIVLNGGLGTTMGLTGPKSLVPVKPGECFLDRILSDARRENVALCLMNSDATHGETCQYVGGCEAQPQPLMFFQNMFPKVLADTLMPAHWPADPRLEWNPAGHGDVYNSLYSSGLLEKLLARGIHYAFISNADNLGASLDCSLLGYFSRAGLSFMMEVARRTVSDAKGGHLALDESGAMVLRESAQCRSEDQDAFQDIHRHRFFNTNNIWINLVRLKKRIERTGGIRLPIMLNPKHLDPRDPESPKVYQIETAMGAALSVFQGTGAVCVPRSRFAPVKSTADLLVLRSDRYRHSPEGGIVPAPGTDRDPIFVRLDPRYYRCLDQFEARFAHGVPSLAGCRRLTIEGDIFFEGEVTLLGDVTITATGPGPRTIPRGTVIASDLSL